MRKANLIKSLSLIFVLCLTFALVPFFGNAGVVKAGADSITIAGETVDISSFETYAGASIRYDAENKGIRFVTGINQDKYDELNTLATENGYTVTFGTIVTYSYRVQKCIDANKDFTKDALNEVIETSGSKYVDFGVKAFREKSDVESNVEYTAVLGITEANYNIPMSARGYVVISNGESEEIYYSKYEILNSTAENVSRTLFEDFVGYGVNSDTKLAAIAEYTKNVTEDGFSMKGQSAMRPFTNDSANVSIETDQAIGGRAGVSKYTLITAAKGWAERLTPTFASKITWDGQSKSDSDWHLNPLNRQKAMGFKYVLFDIYLQDAFDIYFPTSTGLHSYVKVSTAGDLVYRERYKTPDGSIAAQVTTDEAITSKVKFYNMAGEQVTTTYSGLWYTVAVDISCNLEMSSNSAVETALSFSSASASVYFDNVKYYRTNAWESTMAKTKQNMDLSEFGLMLDNAAYENFEITSFGGRNNVKHYYEDNNGTLSKAGFMFTSNFDANGNSIGKTAQEKVKNSGVKYISFEICRGNNAPIAMYAWDNNYTGNTDDQTNKLAPFTIVYNTGAIGKQPSNVKLYDMAGNLVTAMSANTWYTIVIEINYDVTSSHWSAIHFSTPWLNIGIDNIVYYYNEVPALWK